MGLENTSKGPEKREVIQNGEISETQSLTANYVILALEFYRNLDFSNITHENYKNICTWFQTSGESDSLRLFLGEKGIKVYSHFYDKKSHELILLHGDCIYIEAANLIIPRDEFEAQNMLRYVRLITIDHKIFCITLVGNTYFYAQAFSLDINGRLFSIQRLDGTYDLLDKAYKKVYEIGALQCGIHQDGESFRFFLDESSTIYIDFNGFEFSKVQQVREDYPCGTQTNTHSSASTIH